MPGVPTKTRLEARIKNLNPHLINMCSYSFFIFFVAKFLIIPVLPRVAGRDAALVSGSCGSLLFLSSSRHLVLIDTRLLIRVYTDTFYFSADGSAGRAAARRPGRVRNRVDQ